MNSKHAFLKHLPPFWSSYSILEAPDGLNGSELPLTIRNHPPLGVYVLHSLAAAPPVQGVWPMQPH